MLTIPPWTQNKNLAYGFSERLDGDFRIPKEPSIEFERRWRKLFVKTASSLEQVALVHQTHGNKAIYAVSGRGVYQTLGDADALWTELPNIVLAIRTADCVPILVAGERCIAAIHAGWRGVVEQVIPNTIKLLITEGYESPFDLRVVIGPHIGREAFEVGVEVAEVFASVGLEAAILTSQAKPNIDLEKAIRQQLKGVGVEHVATTSHCTVLGHQFFSHRREGERAGRMVAWITKKEL